MGFVVERYKQIKEFVPEKFWSIVLQYEKQGNKKEHAKFEWDRNRVFDKLTCLALLEKCQESKIAKVTYINK